MKNLNFGSIIALVFLAATSLNGQTTTTTAAAASTSHWTVVPSPNVSGQDNILASVAANSATDVWAVDSSFPMPTRTSPRLSSNTGTARP
jgi:hypothetical protein